MTKHTPEPWTTNGARKASNFGQYEAFITGPEVARVATVQGGNVDTRESTEANAARIVACVNACAGLNPEAVPGLVKALKRIRSREEHCLSVSIGFNEDNYTDAGAALAAVRQEVKA